MAHMTNWSHICDPTRKAVNSFPGKCFWREREASKMEYVMMKSPVSKDTEISELLLQSAKAKLKVLENLNN